MSQKIYYSMMGLLNEDKIESKYSQQVGWSKFKNLDEVLEMMKRNEIGTEDKHSVPDIYGRMIQYYIVLKAARKKSIEDKDDFLCKEILAWRGILAMLALQKFLGLDLRYETVTFDKQTDVFGKALSYPMNLSMFQNRAWGLQDKTYYALKVRGDAMVAYKDIALYSPTTLIYPIADVHNELPEITEVRWFNHRTKSFINPGEVLSDTEKMIVCFWIENLIETLRNEQEDLQEDVYEKEAEQDDIERENDTRRRNERKDVILYHLNAFLKDLEKGEIGQERLKKQCFFMKEADNTSVENPKEIVRRLFGETVEVKLIFDGNTRVRYQEALSEQLYCTRTDENPFKDCKYIEQYFINGKKKYFAFIPIGKAFQEFVKEHSMDKWLYTLQMDTNYDRSGQRDGIKVVWHLSEVNAGNVDVEKVYRFNGDIIEEERDFFPNVAIWPKARIDNWKNYYIYMQGGVKGKIAIEGGEKGSNPYVTKMDGFPEVIFFNRKIGEKVYDIGILCPNGITIEQAGGIPIKAVVGIDFGTSGTTVYVNINNQRQFQVKISQDLSLPLTRMKTDDKEMMSYYFIGDENVEEKLYSVYKKPTEKISQLRKPIVDGIIYQATQEEMIRHSENFMSNIKWNNIDGGVYYQMFLQELCMHVWAILQGNGITQIEWRYALPKDIPFETQINNMWSGTILQYIISNVGIEDQKVKGGYTESKASSLYFLHGDELGNINVNKGYLIVDIGGGSTDIAVWQKNKESGKIEMLGQTSVATAGRSLFIRWIAQNLQDIKNQVFLDDDALKEQLESVKRLRDEGYGTEMQNAVLERIVNSQQDKIMKAYGNQGGEWTARLRGQLEFGLALVLFSLGSLVGYLRKGDILKENNELGNFYIAFAGNGSKILEWIDIKGDYEKLKQMFIKGIESRESGESCDALFSPLIIKSQRPKEEVALGLIQPDDGNLADRESDIREDIDVNTAIRWNRIFLREYNRIFGKSMSLDENQIGNLMAGMIGKMDVCNFFMKHMYDMYYKDII